MKKAIALCLGLAGCAQAAPTLNRINELCAVAQPLAVGAPKAGVYIAAACSAAGIAKLASDSSSEQWLLGIVDWAKRERASGA